LPDLLDIVGQDAALTHLQRAMHSARSPHAWLFSGSIGVGRRTAAVAWAKVLLCEQPATRPNAGRLPDLPGDFPLRLACARCPSCRAVDAGLHADFHLITKELLQYHPDPKVRDRVMQDLGIDVIREFLIAPAGRAPTGGKGKVFVVLEADLLSEPAQNALLKTLEEPPRGVTIILIASQAESLLPTTLSRCRLVNFFPLPADFVRQRLIASGVEAEQAAFWAGYTAGSLGEALRLAAREMYPVKRELLERLADPDPAAEAALADWLTKTAEALADRLVAEAKADQSTELSRQLANRRAAATVLPMMASVFRDALTVATGADRVLVHADQPQAATTLAGRFSVAQLAAVVEQLDSCEQLLWRNVNPRLIWDNVAVTVASAAPLRL